MVHSVVSVGKDTVENADSSAQTLHLFGRRHIPSLSNYPVYNKLGASSDRF